MTPTVIISVIKEVPKIKCWLKAIIFSCDVHIERERERRKQQNVSTEREEIDVIGA